MEDECSAPSGLTAAGTCPDTDPTSEVICKVESEEAENKNDDN